MTQSPKAYNGWDQNQEKELNPVLPCQQQEATTLAITATSQGLH